MSSIRSCRHEPGKAGTLNPLVAGVTQIRSVHITQLQQAVNQIRTAMGLPAFSFTPAGATELVKVVHISQLRLALDEARSVLDLGAAAYTDATLIPGMTPIRAIHVAQLRSGVQ